MIIEALEGFYLLFSCSLSELCRHCRLVQIDCWIFVRWKCILGTRACGEGTARTVGSGTVGVSDIKSGVFFRAQWESFTGPLDVLVR